MAYIDRAVCLSILRAKANMAVLMDAAPYFEKAAQMLEKLPAADVVPVVHGRWEKEPSSYWRWTSSGAVAVTRTTYRCGLCGRGTAVKSNYCPNCGAKMDGGNS
jgi:hypothetical protein